MEILRPKCKVCNTLLEVLENCQGEDYKIWELGTISEIFNNSNCEHEAFLKQLGATHDSYESLHISLYKGSLSLGYCYVDDDDGKKWYGSTAGLLVLDFRESLPGVHQGRHLDSDYIDPKLIRKWMSYCYDNHGLDCKSETQEISVPFDWLVDVDANCIVPAPKDPSFLALSYVWGQTPTLKTTKANLSALRQPGSLAGTLFEAIPATIRHAIGLARLLGQQYLWVDSLCIVQDDGESVRRHIEHLASIFESAVLTIVAADGEDANCGLNGLRGVANPRELPPTLALSDTLGITARVGSKITHSKWSTRGWTLQESLFSRRKLVFIGGSVRWICQSSDYYEEIDSPLDMESGTLRLDGAYHKEKRSVQDLALGYPDMARLMDLLADYSGRALTFDEDILSAISSTLGALWRAFPSGFIYGLPVSFLDAALLWRSSAGKLRHRQASSGNQSDCPPSWTWAGWKGRMDALCWTSNTYLKEAPFAWGRAHRRNFQAIPILKWHTCTTQQSRPVPIPHHSEWYEFKKQHMGKPTELPSGWHYRPEDMEALRVKVKARRDDFKDTPDLTRFDDGDCPIDSEDSEELQTPYFYSHDSVPGLKFWHPVPIGDHMPVDGEFTRPAYGRFLWAKTQQARLWAAKPRPSPSVPLAASYRKPDQFVAPMFSTMLGVTTVLRDEEDVDVGEMQIDTQADFDGVMKHEKEGKETGLPCDLVAISRGFDFASPMEPGKEVYTFYNVLWVAWEDGIAYRRGVGRVKRKTWESLERNDIELVLG